MRAEAGSDARAEMQLDARSPGVPAMKHGLIAIVLIAAAGVGGYVTGRSGGEDLSAARSAGTQQGHNEGTAEGTQRGTREGLRAGRKVGYRRAYRRAYRLAYRKASGGQSRPPRAGYTVARDCTRTGAEPNISGLSVRGMTCGQAEGVISRFGAISQSFTVLGFACDRLSGGDLGGTWRCTRGAAAFRFAFGD